jgi:hypothetical protein
VLTISRVLLSAVFSVLPILDSSELSFRLRFMILIDDFIFSINDHRYELNSRSDVDFFNPVISKIAEAGSQLTALN